jgi:hypothetical protein
MTMSFEESRIAAGVATLTKRQIAVLRKAEAGEDLVCEHGVAFIGLQPTSVRTIYALLRVCAISPNPFSGGSFERYVINSTGKEILRRLGTKK